MERPKLTIQKQGDKYRFVLPQQRGIIAVNPKTGKPYDKGGYYSKLMAQRERDRITKGQPQKRMII